MPEEILRAPPKILETKARMSKVAETIQWKINQVKRVRPVDQWDFLTEFYRQQRKHLEGCQLFGEARENKFQSK